MKCYNFVTVQPGLGIYHIIIIHNFKGEVLEEFCELTEDFYPGGQRTGRTCLYVPLTTAAGIGILKQKQKQRHTEVYRCFLMRGEIVSGYL